MPDNTYFLDETGTKKLIELSANEIKTKADYDNLSYIKNGEGFIFPIDYYTPSGWHVCNVTPLPNYDKTVRLKLYISGSTETVDNIEFTIGTSSVTYDKYLLKLNRTINIEIPYHEFENETERISIQINKKSDIGKSDTCDVTIYGYNVAMLSGTEIEREPFMVSLDYEKGLGYVDYSGKFEVFNHKPELNKRIANNWNSKTYNYIQYPYTSTHKDDNNTLHYDCKSDGTIEISGNIPQIHGRSDFVFNNDVPNNLVKNKQYRLLLCGRETATIHMTLEAYVEETHVELANTYGTGTFVMPYDDCKLRYTIVIPYGFASTQTTIIYPMLVEVDDKGNYPTEYQRYAKGNIELTDSEPPFSFGITEDGKYGYYKKDEETITEFSTTVDLSSIANEWSNEKTYSLGEYCMTGSVLWKSLVNNNVNNTPVEGAYWTKQNIAENIPPFKMGVNGDGIYGYYKADGSFTPFKSGGGGGTTLTGLIEVLEYTLPGTNSSSSGFYAIGSIFDYANGLQAFRVLSNRTYEGEYISLYNSQIKAKKSGKYFFAKFYLNGANMVVTSDIVSANAGDLILTGSQGYYGSTMLCAYLGEDEPIMNTLCTRAQFSDTSKYLTPINLTDSIYNYKYLLADIELNGEHYYSCAVPASTISLNGARSIQFNFNNDGTIINTVSYGGAYLNYYITLRGVN